MWIRSGERRTFIGPVEWFGIGVIVFSIFLMGWLIFQDFKDPSRLFHTAGILQTANLQPSNQQTATNAQAAPTISYLHIKEWKVRLALDSNTTSLYYNIKPELPNVAYLSLQAVSKAGQSR